MTDVPLTLPLDDHSAAELETAGGKGASLVRLVAAGLPVPDGFIVSTEIISPGMITPFFF